MYSSCLVPNQSVHFPNRVSIRLRCTNRPFNQSVQCGHFTPRVCRKTTTTTTSYLWLAPPASCSSALCRRRSDPTAEQRTKRQMYSNILHEQIWSPLKRKSSNWIIMNNNNNNNMINHYSSHSGEISKITAAVHIRASMKINIKHKTKY